MGGSGIGNVIDGFRGWFYPGAPITWEDWLRFCERISGHSPWISLSALLVMLIVIWTQPNATEPKRIKLPNRVALGWLWLWVVLFYIITVMGFQSGIRSDFFGLSPLLYVLVNAVVSLLTYSILACVITSRFFYKKYKFTTWVCKLLRNRRKG